MMKKRFMDRDLKPSNEDYEDPTPEDFEQTVSLEEEQMAAMDVVDSMSEMDATMDDIHRSSDQAAHLDAMADAMNKIEDKPALIIQDLVALAGQAAVAGTNLQPEDLVPALETLDEGGLRVSVEGIREKARRLWEWVREQLDKMREYLIKFAKNIQMLIFNQRSMWNDVARLHDKFVLPNKATFDTSIKGRQVPRSTHNVFYQIDGKPITGEEDTRRALETIHSAKQNLVFFSDSMKSLSIHAVESIRRLTGALNASKKFEALETIGTQSLNQINYGQRSFLDKSYSNEMKSSVDESGKEMINFDSTPLLGNKAFNLRAPKGNPQKGGGDHSVEGEVKYAKLLQHSGLFFVDSIKAHRVSNVVGEAAGVAASDTMAVWSPDFIYSFVKGQKWAASDSMDMFNGQVEKKNQDVLKTIETACGELAKKVEELEKAGETMTAEQASVFDAIMHVPVWCVSMMRNPWVEFAYYYYRLTNALLSLFRAHCLAYKGA